MQDDLLQQAADWYDRKNTLSKAESREFTLWISNDEHRFAYNKIARAMNAAEVTLALEHAALKKAKTQKTNPFADLSLRVKLSLLDRHAGIAASFAALCFIVCIGIIYTHFPKGDSYHAIEYASTQTSNKYTTPVGKMAFHTLSDGSDIQLNAKTALTFASKTHERHVNLLDGQALFDVAHESKRPFIIQVGPSKIVVLGTVFDVDYSNNRVAINVYDGLVSVSNSQRAIKIKRGESLYISPDGFVRLKSHDRALPTWQSGWLEVEDEPLTHVLDKFQRHVTQGIVVHKNVQPNIRISGRFDLEKPIKSLKLLAATSDLNVDISNNAINISNIRHSL